MQLLHAPDAIPEATLEDPVDHQTTTLESPAQVGDVATLERENEMRSNVPRGIAHAPSATPPMNA